MVQYNGNCNWERSAPPIWSIASEGYDRLTEIWMGRRDRIGQFRDRFARWARHPDYPGMFFDRMVDDDDPVIGTVQIEYIGFRRGLIASALPAPKYRAGQSVQSATGSATINGKTTTLEVSFYAQSGEYEWFQITPPGQMPQHAGIVSTLLPTDRIITWKITDENNHPVSADMGAVTAALNSLVITTLIADYTPEELVPGKIWHCRSMTVRTLQ